MAKKDGSGQYGEVVTRLKEIVEALEAGELPLEASLERFAEGIALVKQGEALLSEAEHRIEQLLSDDGRTAPLRLSQSGPPSAPPAPVLATPMATKAVRRAVSPPTASPEPAAPAPAPPTDELDDVPF